MEQITGPIHGFHIACYTIPTPDGHYGYAKICTAKPKSVWDAGIGVRKVGIGPFATEKQAVVAVQEEACRRLALRAAELRYASYPYPGRGAQGARHRQ